MALADQYLFPLEKQANVAQNAGAKARDSERIRGDMQEIPTTLGTVEHPFGGPASPASEQFGPELLLPGRGESAASALERRLRRLAFDLHDGALQELAALAGELASMRRQVVPLVDAEVQERVDG